MTKGNMIKKCILELLADGKEHTTVEIREYLDKQNVVIEKNSTLIRNIIHNMKGENPNFVNVGRGVYQLRFSEDNNLDLENAINVIEKSLREYKRFDWITCDDSQLNIARTKAQRLIKLADKIKSEMSVR